VANEEVRDEHVEACLSGGGSMGEIMRSIDWSKTPLGAVETWSPTLRAMISFLLANRFPLLLWWGPDYTSIYNDAYRPILGKKHPHALGQSVRECWSEIWHVLQPLIDTPFKGGPATWMDDISLEINRHGYVEETHFTIAYSPVPDETAPRGIGGVLATVHEITEKIVADRRVLLLRDLASRTAEAKSAEEACAIAAGILSQYPKDVPFALLYAIDADRKRARLAGAAGVLMGEAASPMIVDLDGQSGHEQVWPLADVVQQGAFQRIENLSQRLARVPPGPWSDPPDSAVLMPIRSNISHQLAGVIVIGISSRLCFNDAYQGFCDLVAGQVATTIANARAYEEERKRAEALAEIDRAKTLFFSNVSHEFRTPLTLMLGPVEDMLNRAESLHGGVRKELELVHRNGLRMQKLVNTLLDFSRIEAGRTHAVYTPVDLAEVTQELAGNFRSLTERAGLKLIVDCPPLPEPAYVDREMWEKIVFNLLSNAFKFTFAGGITVSVNAAGDHAELVVADTGTGISEHELPLIFERFHRIEGARGRTYEGTGIGLSLIQELVWLHGGSITVESRLDEGTTFRVRIPLGAEHLPPDRIGAARTLTSTALSAAVYVEEAARWLPDDIASSRGVASSSPWPTPDLLSPDPAAREVRHSRTSPPRQRILVADDNSDMRDYFSRILSDTYIVDLAANGEEAFGAALNSLPDLVVADIMMPDADGFELLRRLRSQDATRSVPVILVSARAGEEARIEGLQRGADDYLTKPFSARELRARVDARLELVRVRKKVEGERGRLAAIVESSDDAIVSKDLNGVILSWNAGAERLFGYTAPEAIGQPVTMLIPTERADEEPVILERIRRGERVEHYETIRRRKDGTQVDISLSVSPILDEYGRVVGASKIARDITERKRIEQERRELAVAIALRETEAELARVTRALTVGELSTSIAHEVNQPLAAVVTNAEAGLRWLNGETPNLREARESLALIVRDGNRASEVIRRIREFLKKDSVEAAQLDINDVVREAVFFARGDLLKSQVTLRCELCAELPPVRGDRVQLEQVILNLIINAREAMAPVADGQRELVMISQKFAGDGVLVAVRDSGAGVNPQDIDRLFTAFFTTKSKGMGMGLSISRSIIEAHGGRIWAVLNDGPGLTVQFTLPAASQNPS
jgi:PAS domain S-box-containing protein